MKLIVSNDEEMKLLGMRAIGDNASAIIETAALLIQEGRSIKALDILLHPHPAITEAVQECARMLMGHSIYKPHVFASCWIGEYQPEKGRAYKGMGKIESLVPSYLDLDYDPNDPEFCGIGPLTPPPRREIKIIT